MRKKHAVLIMAHNNIATLEKLIRYFDHPEIDIFLHWDKKAQDLKETHFQSLCTKSNIYLIKRKKVFWGTHDQIFCEMDLFENAFRKGPFSYYHLISGNDIPLVPLNVFLDFFQNNQKNYLLADEEPQFEIRLKIYFNLMEKIPLPAYIKFYLNTKINALQLKLGIDRLKVIKKEYPNLRHGHNWCDLTQEAVEEILSHKYNIKRFFFLTSCGDEMYKPTILYNSALRNTLTNEDIREIDWSNKGPHPKTFTISDYPQLKEAAARGKLFARKVNEKIDNEIIEKIYSEIG